MLMIALLLLAAPSQAGTPPTERVAGVEELGLVWSGHPVGFDLKQAGDRLFVAYYDAERHMTVASRRLGERTWQKVVLPETVGWDSHNYIALTVDAAGLIHVSGNMHAVKLVYFRSRRPYDISTLERATPMVGEREARATYPVFFEGPGHELVFTYRDGASGNGDQIYNLWDPAKQAWHRLLDRALTSGEGHCNAYLHGPVLGPDGWYHLCWVWRNTPDCSTNHDLCYARSRDLVHWETSGGAALALPILRSTAEVVDPVPPGGGILNGNTLIGFDHERRVVLSYHKFDAAGNTQLYCARREADGWQRYQLTHWNYRWYFSGGGSIIAEIGLGAVSPAPDGSLRLSWRHAKFGSGVWRLDDATLAPTGDVPREPSVLDPLGKPESAFAGMGVRWRTCGGGRRGVRYALRWETLGANRDAARQPPWPEPSHLRLYELVDEAAAGEGDRPCVPAHRSLW